MVEIEGAEEKNENKKSGEQQCGDQRNEQKSGDQSSKLGGKKCDDKKCEDNKLLNYNKFLDSFLVIDMDPSGAQRSRLPRRNGPTVPS